MTTSPSPGKAARRALGPGPAVGGARAVRNVSAVLAVSTARPGWLSLDTVWLLLPCIVSLVLLNLQTIAPNDFWWHLRTGQIIVQTHVIPNVDLFTFTRSGMPWTNQGWLMQSALYLLYQAGGLPLVLFCHAVAVTGGYLLVELACLRVSHGRVRAAALAVVTALLLGMTEWSVRPQTISFLLFGALVYVLVDHSERGGRLIWSLPVLFALWVNAHGAFVFGAMLLVIYVAGRAFSDLRNERRLSAATHQAVTATLASLLALAVNPSGPAGMLRYLLGFLRSEGTQNFNLEFLPLSLREGDGKVFFACVIAFLLLAYWRRVRLSFGDLLILLVFGLLSLWTRRVAPWFGMAFAPAWAALLAGTGDRPAPVRPRAQALNGVLITLLLLAAVASLPWLRGALPLPAERRAYVKTDATPAAAAAVLCRQGSHQQVWAEIGYASYLTWTCPSAAVFMDTRFELYPGGMWRDYDTIATAQYGWEALVQRYGVNTLLIRKAQQPQLAAASRVAPGWRVAYEDQDALLLQAVP